MTGARRRVPLRSPKTPIGSVDPYALKIPARRAECLFTTPHCLHSPPSSIRGVAPPGPPKWLHPPPPLTPAQSSTLISLPAPNGAVWCWVADRKGSIEWAPFLLPAIAPAAKPLYVGTRHPRTHARVAPAPQRTATPTNPWILRASGSSSIPWRGVPPPEPSSAAASRIDIGSPADLGRCTRGCGSWAAWPRLPPGTRPPPHREVSWLPNRPGTQWHLRSRHRPLPFGPPIPNRGPRLSPPALTATSPGTRLPLGSPLSPDAPDPRSRFPANTTASSTPRYPALRRGAN